jgi:hypothetical protein
VRAHPGVGQNTFLAVFILSFTFLSKTGENQKPIVKMTYQNISLEMLDILIFN